MNIGSVHPTPAGELQGHLAIMSFDARIGFKPVASANERAPKFEIVAVNCAKRWVRIGALWEKEAKETGEVYLAGHVDDPCLPTKLFVAAFRQADDTYSIAWTRANPQAQRLEGRGGANPGFDEVEGREPDYGREPTADGDAAPRGRGRRRAAEPEVEGDPFA